MPTDLILGTAGHIDHGKTSLIRALTGVDTDRLPEEKKRGITIELGFAELDLGDYRLGIVDVPGHERFVRNMLAGATGIDLALLVVAADDSVKPQTREHLEILRLLDLQAGLIAITKTDLTDLDPDWIDMVEDEVRELVAGTFLADAPIIRTSAPTGAGLDELRDALARAAEQIAVNRAAANRAAKLDGPFRLAIDRAFTITGHGTVVTGSISSGTIHVGDEMVIEPGDIQVRVRGIQNHDRSVEAAHRGQRAAINLVGIRHAEIRRGQELATPGHLIPSRLLSVQLSLLPSAPRPLKHRARVRLHVGTAELICSVMLLDRDRLEAGQTAPVQLMLSEPAVTTWRQPLVVRSESPVVTIGGGHVLEPDAARAPRNDRQTLEMMANLLDDEPIQRASAALYFAGLRDWRPDDLARTAGIDDVAAVGEALRDRGDLQEIALSPTRTFRLHALVLEQLCQRVEAALAKLHEEFPLQSMLDYSRLVRRFAYLGAYVGSDALVRVLVGAVIERMKKAKRVKLTERGIALAGHGPQLSANEQRLVDEIIADFREAGFQPPSVKQLQAKATRNQASVPQLVELAVAEGHLVKIAADFYLHSDSERQVRDILDEQLSGGEGMTLSQIRELLGTTRKYAVPLCEYLDRQGFTRREGDLRVLGAAVSPRR
ncbi:MAG: selenocysteine-specific translation elongation factor [Planctomycetes bacterium]|nr:selenocysteine-specific translation elongation factor [Planctomycetota bacterium]